MGTNFYLSDMPTTANRMDPRWHIGKRSAAGAYCWDCGTTLCRLGEDHIFTSDDSDWLDKCPYCGKKPNKETWDSSTVGRELGFNKDRPMAKTGVASCSSFTWCMSPKALLKLPRRGKFIVNEYGDKLSIAEFVDILEECPIEFMRLGAWFS